MTEQDLENMLEYMACEKADIWRYDEEEQRGYHNGLQDGFRRALELMLKHKLVVNQLQDSGPLDLLYYMREKP